MLDIVKIYLKKGLKDILNDSYIKKVQIASSNFKKVKRMTRNTAHIQNLVQKICKFGKYEKERSKR
jgi:hypothetical protein